jgi:hypothetical protein
MPHPVPGAKEKRRAMIYKRHHQRRHHNTKGFRQIQNGKTSILIDRLNKEISKDKK